MARLPTRQEIPQELQWKLEDIYANNQEWEEDLAKAKNSRDHILALKGTFKSGDSLLKALRIRDEINLLVDRLITYAFMRKDEDNANALYQGYSEQALAVSVELSSAAAFFEPDILNLGSQIVEKWLQQTPGLSVYCHYLHNLLRMEEHTLSAEQEELLAAAGELAEAPANIFRMFNNADLRFPMVKNEDGELVELTHGRYLHLLESHNQEVRRGAFEAMYETYKTWKNTLGTTLLATTKKELYFARAHRYSSSLEAALNQDNVQPQVYTNLIDTIHDHLHLLHRYVRLRKKLLGLAELHMYDLYVPMVAAQTQHISRDEAINLLRSGLRPLGDQYLSDLERAFSEGWIDWLENRGKTSGAYSWGTYRVHPYVLLNHQDNLNSIFTLVHELGHAMHSYYSDQKQEFVNSRYKIFVAEVASTLNEAILFDDLLQKTSDTAKRAYLINHYLEQFRGTVFRQAMLAEFEMIVHGKVTKGESLTTDDLCRIFYDLNCHYFGEDLVVDELISLEWARIPHFYRPFYVYKYATGFSAATALAQQILHEGTPARNRYLDFLSSGGSDYPLHLLQKAGVDLSKPDPIVQAMSVWDGLLTELEQLSEENSKSQSL